jgi:uncharacterized membrane protein YbhN (UPF0104 family)
MISRGRLVQLVKIAITIGILALLAWQFDFRSIVGILSSISIAAVAASIAVLFVQTAILAVRLKSIVLIFNARLRLSESYRVTIESMFFSQTFVSIIGGDGFRIWRIRRLGLPLADATAAVILDRLIGTLINHICLLASLPWFVMILPTGLLKIVLIVLAAGGVAGFLFLLIVGYMRGRLGLFRRLPERYREASIVVFLLEAISVGRFFVLHWRQLIGVFVLCALIAVCNMVMFGLILVGMGVDLRIAAECALLVPAILEIAMIPISIAGWGIREAATVLAFGALGLSADRAVGASVAFGLITTAVSLLGGLLWFTDRRQMGVQTLERTGEASGS